RLCVSPIELLASDAMLKSAVFCEQFDYVARWLVNTPTALPANRDLDIPIQIDGSWDFVIQEYNLVAFDNNDAYQAAPNLLISFTRDGAGRRMSSGPVHVMNICGSYGTSQAARRLPFPVLLPAKTTYSVLLQNLTATAWHQIELKMGGFKVYYEGGADRLQVFHTS